MRPCISRGIETIGKACVRPPPRRVQSVSTAACPQTKDTCKKRSSDSDDLFVCTVANVEAVRGGRRRPFCPLPPSRRLLVFAEPILRNAACPAHPCGAATRRALGARPRYPLLKENWNSRHTLPWRIPAIIERATRRPRFFSAPLNCAKSAETTRADPLARIGSRGPRRLPRCASCSSGLNQA